MKQKIYDTININMNIQSKKPKAPITPTFTYVDIDEKKIVRIAQKMEPAIVQLAKT